MIFVCDRSRHQPSKSPNLATSLLGLLGRGDGVLLLATIRIRIESLRLSSLHRSGGSALLYFGRLNNARSHTCEDNSVHALGALRYLSSYRNSDGVNRDHKMRTSLEDASYAVVLILFGFACIAALPFPLFCLLLRSGPPPLAIEEFMLLSSVSYLIVTIVSGTAVEKAPRFAWTGYITLGISWLIAFCFMLTWSIAATGIPWFRFFGH